jgi:hypothetical protein
VKLSVAVHKHEEQLCTKIGCTPPFWVPDGLRLHVIFTVTDAIGVKKIEKRVTKALGGVETHAIDAGAADKGSVGSELGWLWSAWRADLKVDGGKTRYASDRPLDGI